MSLDTGIFKQENGQARWKRTCPIFVLKPESVPSRIVDPERLISKCWDFSSKYIEIFPFVMRR